MEFLQRGQPIILAQKLEISSKFDCGWSYLQEFFLVKVAYKYFFVDILNRKEGFCDDINVFLKKT